MCVTFWQVRMWSKGNQWHEKVWSSSKWGRPFKYLTQNWAVLWPKTFDCGCWAYYCFDIRGIGMGMRSTFFNFGSHPTSQKVALTQTERGSLCGVYVWAGGLVLWAGKNWASRSSQQGCWNPVGWVGFYGQPKSNLNSGNLNLKLDLSRSHQSHLGWIGPT